MGSIPVAGAKKKTVFSNGLFLSDLKDRYVISRERGCNRRRRMASRAACIFPSDRFHTDLRSDSIPQQVADHIHALGVIRSVAFLCCDLGKAKPAVLDFYPLRKRRHTPLGGIPPLRWVFLLLCIPTPRSWKKARVSCFFARRRGRGKLTRRGFCAKIKGGG